MSNGQIDFLHIGQQNGYIELLNEQTTIHYVATGKKYKFTDPEEQVRARYYVELIERYQYPENRDCPGGYLFQRRTPSRSR